jgi:hypothetical protein
MCKQPSACLNCIARIRLMSFLQNSSCNPQQKGTSTSATPLLPFVYRLCPQSMNN